jgi:hypothetical protein
MGGPAVLQLIGHDEDLVTGLVNDRRTGNANGRIDVPARQ